MYIQAFLFNGRTCLRVATHTYIEVSDWASSGFSRTRTAPKPDPSSGPEVKYHTARQVYSKNLGNLMNIACCEKSLAKGNYMNYLAGPKLCQGAC